MDGIKISIVVATYNGGETIKEQLSSIVAQTRVPDEVIISDDNSTDKTCEIVQSFIEDNNLSNWLLLSNNGKKGYISNFFFGFSKCTGNIIFPCDQDDIWLPNKIQLMSETMINHSEINVLYCNPILWDCGGSKKRIKYEIFRRKFRGKNDSTLTLGNKKLKNKLDTHPGCVLCFKKSFLDDYLSLETDGIAHDLFLCSLSAFSNSLYYLDIPVIKWRQKEISTSKPQEYTKKNKREQLFHIYAFLCNLLNSSSFKKFDVLAIKKIKRFEHLRIKFLEKPCVYFIPLIINSHYSCFIDFLSDLKFSFKRKNEKIS